MVDGVSHPRNIPHQKNRSVAPGAVGAAPGKAWVAEQPVSSDPRAHYPAWFFEEGGVFKEEGTHDSLMALGGYYNQLHKMQYKELASL